MRPSDVIEDMASIRARTAEVAAVVQSAVRSGAATSAQLEAMRATASGLEADIRTLNRELDRRDELDWLVVVDGERTLSMWLWRRSTRSALLGLWRQVHAIATAARDLGGGVRQKLVVVREGDTWQSIAHRELGGWEEWPRLLAANPTRSAGALVQGATVVVPEKR